LATLREQREQLSPMMQAQLTGLEAELALRDGDGARAVVLYGECAAAYVALDRGIDAAEARLEDVLTALRSAHPDLLAAQRTLEIAARELADAAHQPLFLLASARVKATLGSELEARTLLDRALEAARSARQKEWVWHKLEARAELEAAEGQQLLARRDR